MHSVPQTIIITTIRYRHRPLTWDYRLPHTVVHTALRKSYAKPDAINHAARDCLFDHVVYEIPSPMYLILHVCTCTCMHVCSLTKVLQIQVYPNRIQNRLCNEYNIKAYIQCKNTKILQYSLPEWNGTYIITVSSTSILKAVFH